MEARELSLIKEFMATEQPLSEGSFRELAKLFSPKKTERDLDFIRTGRRNDEEYFLLTGICRSYVLDPQGEEVTLQFWQGPAFISPHVTRTEKGISLLNYQALTSSVLVSFPAEDFLRLMIRNLEIRAFANGVLQRELKLKVQREIGLATLTAKERLRRFRADFRGLENIIPHPMIASYLGITPISLLSVRGELDEEGR
jgi:CRP-like cAMP-binding protein